MHNGKNLKGKHMNKSIEDLKPVLTLALEALEVATTPLAKDRQEVLRAQAAIKEALAEQPRGEATLAQQEPVSWERFMSVEKELQDMTAEFMRVAKELVALKAQQAQIPQVITCPFCESQHVPGWLHDYNMDRMKKPAQQQEPVLWLVNGVVQSSDIPADYTGCLYTSPPIEATPLASQRSVKPWQGLTDEEKSDLWCESTGRDFVNEDTRVFADAIEAKLKEKNGF